MITAPAEIKTKPMITIASITKKQHLPHTSSIVKKTPQ